MHRFGGRSAPADGSGAAVAGKKVYTTDCEGNVVYSSSSTNDKGEYTITYTATIDDNALYSVGTAKVRFDRDGGYAASSCECGITVFAPYYTITYDANTAHGGMAYYGSWTNSDAACKESTAMTFSCLCSETSKFSDGTGFIAAVRAEFTAMLNSSTTGYVNGTASDENFIPILLQAPLRKQCYTGSGTWRSSSP